MSEEINLLIQLIKLAETDKTLREAEYNFLLQCANMLGVERNEFEVLFAENIDFSPPKFEMDRILQFYRLVLLANIDLEVSSDEEKFLREAGFRLGLNPDAIENVFNEMKSHKNGMIPTKKLIEIFQVYQN